MNDPQHPVNAVPPGYRLQEYELMRVLGFGANGITYQGFGCILEKSVAVKG